MGCSGSKLTGDKFLDIDAGANPNQDLHRNIPRTRPSDLAASSENPAYLANPSTPHGDGTAEHNKSPDVGSHAYMGTRPFTGKPKESKPKKKRRSFFDYPDDPSLSPRSLDGMAGAGPARRLTLDGAELTSKTYPAQDVSAVAVKEHLASQGSTQPVLRTDQDRARADPVTGKKPGLYQRFTNARMGVGEERDPVTGRGKYTGMTKEETIEYVRRTRGAGLMNTRQYGFVHAGDGMAYGAMGGAGG